MAEEDMTASPKRAHLGGLSGRSDGLSTQAHRRLGRLAYPSPPTAAGRLAADGTMRGGSSIVLIAVIVVVGVVAPQLNGQRRRAGTAPRCSTNSAPPNDGSAARATRLAT